jgi:hypothetical protein
MKIAALLCLIAACAFAQNAAEKTPSPVIPAATPASTLTSIKRVYVDALAGDDSAAAIRELLIASLQQSRLFVVTDNPDRADATLKGAANDTVFTDTFDSQEGLNARANAGSYKGTSTRSSGYGGLSVGENESHHIKERKHEAFATVRLCNRDGDVLWATTQESHGAKFHGASADVAEKVTRQLQLDFGKEQRTPAGVAEPARRSVPLTSSLPR